MKTFSAFAPASHVDGIQGAVCVEIWNDKAFVGARLVGSPARRCPPCHRWGRGRGLGGRVPERRAGCALPAGLSDGYLCTLSAAVESGSPLAAGQWQVQARRAVASRPVTQLAAASSRSMLLALADEGINAFSLPTLMLKCQAARTKGATSFSWDDATDLLCSVNKRRCAGGSNTPLPTRSVPVVLSVHASYCWLRFILLVALRTGCWCTGTMGWSLWSSGR